MAPTLQALRARETFFIESINTLRSGFDLKSTALLGVSQVYHQPDYYLRDYTRYTEQAAQAPERILLPVQYRRLVLYGNSNEGDWQPSNKLESVAMGHGRLYFLTAREGEQIYIDRQGFGVLPASTP